VNAAVPEIGDTTKIMKYAEKTAEKKRRFFFDMKRY